MIRRALLTMGLLLAPALVFAQAADTSPPRYQHDAKPPPGAPEDRREGDEDAGTKPPTLNSTVPARTRPALRVTFDESEIIPGQPLNLRLTVLVPTFMPKPPVWPSFEAPNLLVRVPSRGGGPTSERIGGQTWSGVTRLWHITPMIPGNFSIPPQTILVAWADPDTSQPHRTALTTQPLTLRGKLPEGAERLDPFIGARSLELTQTIEGNPAGMKPGDSITRIVTAKVSGTSPMFLPDLLPSFAVEGLAAYPDTPIVNEVEERGVVGGTRTEGTTLVAEGGGRGQAPPITLEWFNLGTGKVETTTVEGFDIVVHGPPARARARRDWRRVALFGLAGLLGLAMATILLRRAWPRLRRWYEEGKAAWLTSEPYAYARVRRAVARRDYASLHTALDEWALRFDRGDPRLHPAIAAPLLALGATHYGRTHEGDEVASWEALAAALTLARRDMRATSRGSALPPLNPTI